MKTVIVGGVAGGATAAARLRRLDEDMDIVMLEQGPYVSFANCGLPYYIGGVIEDRDELLLQTPESFRARFNIDVRVNSRAVSIDRAGKTVRVQGPAGEYDEPYDKLLLAPGAKAIRPPLPGIDHPRVLTLRNVPDMDRICALCEGRGVKSAVVCGGGFIGIEMAENLLRRGVSVTVVERAEHIMANLDGDMAAELENHIRAQGVRLLTGTSVLGFEGTESGLTVCTDRDELEADLAVLALGVAPDSALAAEAGLTLGIRGSIAVDDHMRTSDPDIYAAGDAVQVTDFVTGAPANVPLAGPANRQGRVAADNIAGLDSTYGGVQGTSILGFLGMTAASTGLSERAARAAGIDYDKTYTFSSSHAAYYPGAHGMSVKLLWARKDGRLLGAQIVGFDGVDKRTDVLAAAIRMGAKAEQLTELELSYAPAFGSAKDPVNFAGYVAENVRSGKLAQFFWDEVDALSRDGSVTLLDVRTPEEYAGGSIPGFVNIPLDELRGRMGEIPAGRPVYVHCRSGQRSYLACRILAANGFACFNLAGGWRLYHEQEINKMESEASSHA